MSNDRVDNLVQQLHEGLQNLVTGEQWQRWLTVASRFHRYSALNVLAIYLQRPDATLCAGYQRWRGLGRQVRRGEKGIAILAPCTYRVANDTSGQDMASDEAEPETARRVLRGFRVVHVFDVAQTDGPPLNTVTPAVLQGDAPAEVMLGLVDVIGVEGFTYERTDMPAGHEASYGITDFDARAVTVRPDLPPAAAVKTTAHETAHVLLHRPGEHDLDRARAEVEAESVAYIVCTAAGIDATDYSLPYVAHWSSGDLDVVRSTTERVIGCARRLLDSLGLASPSDRAA